MVDSELFFRFVVVFVSFFRAVEREWTWYVFFFFLFLAPTACDAVEDSWCVFGDDVQV